MKRATYATLIAGGLALLAACGNAAGTGPGNAEGSAPDGAAVAAVAGIPEGPVRVADENLVALYKQLHESPELSFKEVATSALLANELKTLGFTVTTGLGDVWVKDKAVRDHGEARPDVGGYGVVGVLDNGPGPVVLIRADMDALPVPENTGFAFASKVMSQTWTGVDSPV
ncbi:MAG: hypothetical protein KJ961_13615, partial [Alphaproteobacteria bacterium]|nr:hypothetical protein [Alphaproteobacteria bacterium]